MAIGSVEPAAPFMNDAVPRPSRNDVLKLLISNGEELCAMIESRIVDTPRRETASDRATFVDDGHVVSV